MAADYHDYFIKDGRHVGRYEEMYQNCPDPWRIEELGVRLDMRAALLLLSGLGPGVGRFLDVGAGLGLFTGCLTQALWRENPEARGLVTDISASAVVRARERLNDPRLEFQVLDVRTLANNSAVLGSSYDLIVLAQVLWGILGALPETLAALVALLSPGGHLLLSQHFPGAARQTYGVDLVASPDDLATHLTSAGLQSVATIETNRLVNHHWAALWQKCS